MARPRQAAVTVENATLLRESGESIGSVSKNLGHRDTAVTLDHYDESFRDASERWEAEKRISQRTDRVLRLAGKVDSRKLVRVWYDSRPQMHLFRPRALSAKH